MPLQNDFAALARLSEASNVIDAALSLSTGLNALERRLVAYWTLSTHMLPNLSTFPLLVLRGPMGTGKSECLGIVGRFAYKPRQFVMRGYTQPMIRDEMIAAYEGTALIEEADQGWKDGDLSFERLLSDRYQRGTAKTGVNRKEGTKDKWVASQAGTFGATAIHRRVPFGDAALDGRSISIRFKACLDRGYVDSDKQDYIRANYGLVQDATFNPPEIDQPSGIAPRIFNSYKPLLACAHLCDDDSFTQMVSSRLELETINLKEAQSLEPDGLVLRALLYLCSSQPSSYGPIRLSDIANWIWEQHQLRLISRQVGGLVRSLGVQVKELHGISVAVPTALALVQAIHQVGYDNENELDALIAQVPGMKSRK